LIYKDNYYYW